MIGVILFIVLLFLLLKKKDNTGIVGLVIFNISSYIFNVEFCYTVYALIYEYMNRSSSASGSDWIIILFLLICVPFQIIMMVVGHITIKKCDEYQINNSISKFWKFNYSLSTKLYIITLILLIITGLFVLVKIAGVF